MSYDTKFLFVTDTDLEMAHFAEALAKLYWNYTLKEFGVRYYELTIHELGLLDAISLLDQIQNKPTLTCTYGVLQ